VQVIGKHWRQGPLVVLGGLLALYLAVPLVTFVVRLAGSRQTGFSQAGLFGAFWTSALAATISTGIIALVGIPLAYVLARAKGPVSTVVGFLVAVPLALPPVMAGILLIYVAGPYTPIGNVIDFSNTLAGIVLAQTFVASPFLVVVARAAFASVDPNLYDLAASLGHREMSRFFRVALPSASESIRAGLLLAWLRAFGEYGATVILAFHPYSLPVFTELQFESTGLTTTEAPTALALGLAVVVVLLSRARWRVYHSRAEVRPRPSAPPSVAGAPLAFDLHHRLGNFNLRLGHDGASRRLAILGPSGSGKTVTLRCLAGLYGPVPGSVRYGGEELSQTPTELRRGVGYVPQGSMLFPRLTVWRQVLFGTGADAGRAAYWLERLGLKGLEDRLPSELSGGQRQRVALAQSLSRSPRLLLLDEPFSALDAPVRTELRHELRALQAETGISTVLVTHDPEEAALLADEIVVIVGGEVAQAGRREEVFARPASKEVARLLGISNLFPGRAEPAGVLTCGQVRIAVPTSQFLPGAPVWWSIRPDRIVLGGDGAYPVEIVEMADLGTTSEAYVRFGDNLVLHYRGRLPDGVITAVRADLPAEAVSVWPREAG